LEISPKVGIGIGHIDRMEGIEILKQELLDE
jgi:hypothetical protein